MIPTWTNYIWQKLKKIKKVLDMSPENGQFDIDHQEPSTSSQTIYYGSESKKKKTNHTSFTSNQFNKSANESDQGILNIY